MLLIYASRLVADFRQSVRSPMRRSAKLSKKSCLSWGFKIEFHDQFDDPAGVPKVNVIGKIGSGTGGLAYFAHTDVVPAATWSIPWPRSISNRRSATIDCTVAAVAT